MLYWAEGTKSRNTLEFSNSDPGMVAFFLAFLRRCFSIDDDRVRIRITAYPDNGISVAEIQAMWLRELSLPQTTLIKPVIVQSKSGKTRAHRRLPAGVCSLRVTKSTRILQHIYGAIQEYGGFECPAWLDGPPRTDLRLVGEQVL